MHSAATRGLSTDISMDEVMDSLMRMKKEISLGALTSTVESPTEDNLELQELREQLADLASKVESLTAGSNNEENDPKAIQKLRKQVKEDKEKAEITRNMVYGLEDKTGNQFEQASNHIADLAEVVAGIRSEIAIANNEPVRRLKVHMWDDSTHEHPREDILENEAWTEYNGKFDAESEPWFEFTDDQFEADIIVWITVMARHEKEIPPVNPIKHGDKVIVLDYADGGTLHKQRSAMQSSRTELGYFKRSYVNHGENNSYGGNITDSYPGRKGEGIFPYAYSGTKAMMIPSDAPEANPNFQPKYHHTAKIYGTISKTSVEETNYDDGYYHDPRFNNFLVRYKDRKFNLVNVLRTGGSTNVDRNRVTEWTHEFSQSKAGQPRGAEDVVEDDEKSSDSFASYVGEIDNFCNGHCFGNNYFRHLRDSKIVVTCNPTRWEGDFRLYEAFLSGALVMVDKMYILDWMPNPPIHGKHWVQYDPGDKADFISKLEYYSDPANIDEAEAIAHAGYEHVLKYHMTVNRVDYLLNHEQVKSTLMKRIRDPSKRKILGYPPL